MQDAPTTVEQGTLPSTPAQGADTPNPFASFLLVAGLSLAIFILLRRIYRRPRAGGEDAGLTSRERIEAVKQRAARQSKTGESARLERSMAEAEELTRRLAAILDAKAARLEVLIDDADERIGRLESLQGRTPSEPAGVQTGEPRASIRPRIDPAALDRARLAQLTRERGESPPEPEDEHPPEQDVRERVYQLADGGASAIQIARELDQPVGQVELMLNLRRQTG